ncbi:MAG: hypothetical protein GY798_09840 [Hyphomicrobiales bacterium]|nr:hypothetical protein [Hyphomicrobiales bacterium]
MLQHNCLRYRFRSSGRVAPWTFGGAEGAYQVEVDGSLIANSSPVTVELAIRGLGLTYTFRDYCTDALARGELVEVLTEHQAPVPGVNIYFPREYSTMLPLRLFIDHLKENRG